MSKVLWIALLLLGAGFYALFLPPNPSMFMPKKVQELKSNPDAKLVCDLEVVDLDRVIPRNREYITLTRKGPVPLSSCILVEEGGER